MALLRLDKIIADSSSLTRNEAAALIKSGRVSAGGSVALSRAGKFDPDKDCIMIDKEPVIYKKYRYFMMNKPRGYISATTDRNSKTVIDLLDIEHRKLGLFPAGRLDKDAEGLLLLTNDGDIAHRIMSPAGSIDKCYFVEIDGSITSKEIRLFKEGLTLGGGTKCLPAELKAAPGGVYLTLREGKYHQVKLMMAAVGKPVKHLTRVSVGGLKLDENLKPGEYRELEGEVLRIFNDLETN